MLSAPERTLAEVHYGPWAAFLAFGSGRRVEQVRVRMRAGLRYNGRVMSERTRLLSAQMGRKAFTEGPAEENAISTR